MYVYMSSTSKFRDFNVKNAAKHNHAFAVFVNVLEYFPHSQMIHGIISDLSHLLMRMQPFLLLIVLFTIIYAVSLGWWPFDTMTCSSVPFEDRCSPTAIPHG